MLRKLGVSIYPEKTTMAKDKAYLDLASSYGFERIFMCLLSVDRAKEEVEADFKTIISHAHVNGMEVILDIAPVVFAEMGASYDDLTFFTALGADGIRLDVGFDGLKEAKMTYNDTGLKIELNMSNDIAYLDNILTHQANTANLIGCHNFYPQAFTGLSYEYFTRCSRRFKQHGLRTAAFVNSQQATFGPWEINDGLCTLEMHRNLPIHIQAKHLWATNLIDDVIIGNAYASEAELKALGDLNRYLLELDLIVKPETTPIEKTILFAEKHVRRGDINDYMIRSTEVRKKYHNQDFEPHQTETLHKGDVVIGNNRFGRYKGEMQIILGDIPHDERRNTVARVIDAELFLLPYIGPWCQFKLNEHN